jgi:acrylyl-CoA reductase (NADPH)
LLLFNISITNAFLELYNGFRKEHDKMTKTFKAFRIHEETDNKFTRIIEEVGFESLPEGDVTIEVHYSSLNYKDALSATGNKGVTKKYPHTPGIDAAGVVVDCPNGQFQPGELVLVTGYDLGMNTAGGYGEYIRVPAEWVVKKPDGLSLREAMIYGTAGYTAALSIYKLRLNGVMPDQGDILVTGATGGVGTTAVAILSKLGYSVVGSSGKMDEKPLLLSLGAKDMIHRSELDDQSGKPILKSRWAGVIDTVGGNTLSTAIKTTHFGGSVTTCGNVAAPEFHSSVFPFILNGVNLLGIASAKSNRDIRLKVWEHLSSDWKINFETLPVHEVTLEGLSTEIDLILSGAHKGRTLVKVK